ncbi:MAG: YicC family protein [Treponema sp.]|nr:YicC family protein [Treponema sp.]
MTSMTGYAYREVALEGAVVSVEIKSVNARFLDLTVNMPPHLNQLEQKFRALVCQKVTRGKVDVYVRVKETYAQGTVLADVNAASAYSSAIAEIARSLGKDCDVPLSLIVAQPGVLVAERACNIEKYWNMILPPFSDALDSFCSDRAREGVHLQRDLVAKLEQLDECASFFKSWQPKMEAFFKEQLVQKFTELVGSHVDENRIMTETAAMLVKYTINEEIVRLQSHLASLRAEMHNAAPGKKIDFLCQEINREINTIGSKNQFAEVGTVVIIAKDALENIREQARNVE